MSKLYGKWSVEDVREVILGLDARTGMNEASISIHLSKSLGDDSALGTYRPSKDNFWRSFFLFSEILQ